MTETVFHRLGVLLISGAATMFLFIAIRKRAALDPRRLTAS